ncbi:hypothetical protein C9J12_26930 [Photobacterium frigidiphilum]|uniref:Uncharacterized protein n=1 Tax=Photobacterium frigidiphilum TaxID=264736 RepID=A0A2T3J773_9GAMM|nr:hypothetical protein [Photobacterium frigidiphilum]PSU44578.1 hypothetical protein C9J12_26930 [Photobacterium frigidiphilum]
MDNTFSKAAFIAAFSFSTIATAADDLPFQLECVEQRTDTRISIRSEHAEHIQLRVISGGNNQLKTSISGKSTTSFIFGAAQFPITVKYQTDVGTGKIRIDESCHVAPIA